MKLHSMAGILRSALDRGIAVRVEGLGTFFRSETCYHFTPLTLPRIFVAYVAEDLAPARRLCEALRRRGCDPWLDLERLLPGQNWPRAIERAIQNSDAFLACFSSRSIVKRGQFHSELRYALDCARRMPLDQTFVLPVRLEPCEVPRRISDQTEYVDLFPDWDRGIRRIVRSARRAARMRPAIEFQSSLRI